MRKVELFWDIGSPYTYLVVTQMEGLRQRTGSEIVYRPFLLGGVFKASGNSMPAAIPAKAIYMLEDLKRWRDHYRVPLKLPTEGLVFPLNSLLPMRAAVAAGKQGAGGRFCHALFDRYWGQGRDVSLPDEVASVLGSIGLDGPALLAATATQEVKDELRANTEEAVRRGAFGAPAMFIDDEHYWGNDRLHFIEEKLKERP